MFHGAALGGQRPRPRGRPFSVSRAWGLLLLASGRRPQWLSRSDISRLRSRLRGSGLGSLAPRFVRRAQVHLLRAHPSDLSRIAAEAGVVRTGISAAEQHAVGLLAPDQLDIYVADKRFPDLQQKYALQRSERSNLTVRAIPTVWPFDDDETVVPAAVAAIDLLSSDDQRTHRAGESLLARIDGR